MKRNLPSQTFLYIVTFKKRDVECLGSDRYVSLKQYKMATTSEK